MAHATTRRTTAAKTTIALGLAATTIGIATPAQAAINPGYRGEPRWTVSQDANWETLANLPMRTVVHVPGYGWRAEFCVDAGARWDSGTFYGYAWGNVEARARVYVNGPAGRCTQPVTAGAVLVDVAPLYVAPGGRLDWYANHGCATRAFQWNTAEVVAWKGSGTCSAPTVSGPGSNYLMGGYSATVTVTGQAFPDQPSSQFYAQWNLWPARRV